jgi:threonine dehydratase
VDITEVFEAHKAFSKNGVVTETVTTLNKQLSELFQAEIYFKREDLQKGIPLVT